MRGVGEAFTQFPTSFKIPKAAGGRAQEAREGVTEGRREEASLGPEVAPENKVTAKRRDEEKAQTPEWTAPDQRN